MATAFTHAFVAAALVPIAPRRVRGWKLAVTLVALSILPDFDVVAFHFGVPYHHPLGHRGFSHSLLFAAGSSFLVCALLFPELRRFSRAWWRTGFSLFLAAASHGVLDALTDAGFGVGFFIPFDCDRYFLPWRPLLTSPINPIAFFQPHGLTILTTEILWVWLPVSCVVALRAIFIWILRTRGGSKRGCGS